MYAIPISERVDSIIHKKADIFKLFDKQWNDKSIAMYLSGDTKTIRRFRAAYDQFGKDATAEHIKSFVIIQ